MESFEQVQLDNWNTSSTHKSLLNDEEIKLNDSLVIGLSKRINSDRAFGELNSIKKYSQRTLDLISNNIPILLFKQITCH